MEVKENQFSKLVNIMQRSHNEFRRKFIKNELTTKQKEVATSNIAYIVLMLRYVGIELPTSGYY